MSVKSLLALACLLAAPVALALSTLPEKGLAPLHHAARAGDVNAMVALLNAGAAIDAPTSFGRTALELALDSGQPTAAFILASRGASVRAGPRSQPMSFAATGLVVRPFHEVRGVLEVLDRGGVDWRERTQSDQNVLHKLAMRRPERVEDAVAFIEWLKAKGLSVDPKDTLTGTPLHIAIKEGNETTTRAFLDAGASLSARGARGHDALAEALREGISRLAEVLVDRGAPLDAVDAKGNGAMYWAAYGGTAQGIRLLQLHGLDLKARFAGGASGLHIARSREVVLLFLEAGVPVDARDDAGRTPLFDHVQSRPGVRIGGVRHPDDAYDSERLAIVRALLDAGADPNARDQAGRTALDAVAGHGVSPATAALLRERGAASPLAQADRPVAPGVDIRGERNLFHIALNGTRGELADRLDRGARADTRGSPGDETLLHLAAEGGNVDAARLLIERGADVNAKSTKGRTPLHVAVTALSGHSSDQGMARLLLEHGADALARTTEGRTPLHLAALVGNLAAIDLLLAKPGVSLALRDASGRTPLLVATSPTKSVATVTHLLALGASLGEVDDAGNSLVMQRDVAHSVELTRLYVDRGGDVKLRNRSGATRLHLPLWDPQIAKSVLDAGAEVDARDERGYTPMHALLTATHGRSRPVVRVYLERKADPNATDPAGRTPLHLLAATPNLAGHGEFVRILLEGGADPKRKDADGNTPMDLAKKNGTESVVEALERFGR